MKEENSRRGDRGNSLDDSLRFDWKDNVSQGLKMIYSETPAGIFFKAISMAIPINMSFFLAGGKTFSFTTLLASDAQLTRGPKWFPLFAAIRQKQRALKIEIDIQRKIDLRRKSAPLRFEAEGFPRCCKHKQRLWENTNGKLCETAFFLWKMWDQITDGNECRHVECGSLSSDSNCNSFLQSEKRSPGKLFHFGIMKFGRHVYHV